MGHCLLLIIVIQKKLFVSNKIIGEKSRTKNKRKNNLHMHKLCLFHFSYLFVAFLLSLSLRTITRCLVWNQERSLLQSALVACPYSLKVLNNLALVLLNTKDNRKAGERLDKALKIFPWFKNVLFNRGQYFIKQTLWSGMRTNIVQLL